MDSFVRQQSKKLLSPLTNLPKSVLNVDAVTMAAAIAAASAAGAPKKARDKSAPRAPRRKAHLQKATRLFARMNELNEGLYSKLYVGQLREQDLQPHRLQKRHLVTQKDMYEFQQRITTLRNLDKAHDPFPIDAFRKDVLHDLLAMQTQDRIQQHFEKEKQKINDKIHKTYVEIENQTLHSFTHDGDLPVVSKAGGVSPRVGKRVPKRRGRTSLRPRPASITHEPESVRASSQIDLRGAQDGTLNTDFTLLGAKAYKGGAGNNNNMNINTKSNNSTLTPLAAGPAQRKYSMTPAPRRTLSAFNNPNFTSIAMNVDKKELAAKSKIKKLDRLLIDRRNHYYPTDPNYARGYLDAYEQRPAHLGVDLNEDYSNAITRPIYVPQQILTHLNQSVDGQPRLFELDEDSGVATKTQASGAQPWMPAPRTVGVSHLPPATKGIIKI